ncbi:hypothetical protein [Vagococcus sp.]|uniref:hypothetical protein n=1 Tax=Vagococcus sp. TaxID=1933889 RepID=UPI003F9A6BD6
MLLMHITSYLVEKNRKDMQKFKVVAIVSGKEVTNKIEAASFQDVVNQYKMFELVSIERVEG